VESIIQTKAGGFVFVLAIAFGGAALLYFGGKWFVVRFSDPKWLKKYMPLFFFIGVTLRIAQVVMRLLERWISDQLAGILFVGYILFITACFGAWKRYLAVHPDGPPDPPPTRIENDARPEA
jgi:hypothetical protein